MRHHLLQSWAVYPTFSTKMQKTLNIIPPAQSETINIAIDPIAFDKINFKIKIVVAFVLHCPPTQLPPATTNRLSNIWIISKGAVCLNAVSEKFYNIFGTCSVVCYAI